ncbi:MULTISPECIES: ABC transporter ATP-binding protein [Leptotrichia]|mgnify:CR=1 FL=1|jgi:ABC transporter, ATP-binding protein|uniref:ABC transporter, ATP-binding protein n=1 Tax=Leptotrichia hofstadii F0254 TaxID=634994 RepID=C9MZF9_9FUSO|nr:MULTISPECIES: ABC transporter ATP-binding protein [Leptotrichia]EEX74008.1 ABC transporter, ATP-binding protein [Leptotrichia hofstadii F0254]
MDNIILKCNGLSKSYDFTNALNNVNLSVKSGKIVGLLGPNGSGKTTFIKLLNGLLKPTQGEILIDGKNPGTETKKIVAYLPDKNYLDNTKTVKAILRLFADFYEDFDLERALKMLKDLDIDSSKRFKLLSKGTKEKVQLILVMCRKAKLYLLDEPIAGVDPAARDYILNTIIKNCNKEAAVIISTHLIADVEPILDEAIFISKGDILLHQEVETIKKERNMTVDNYFREVFKY